MKTYKFNQCLLPIGNYRSKRGALKKQLVNEYKQKGQMKEMMLDNSLWNRKQMSTSEKEKNHK